MSTAIAQDYRSRALQKLAQIPPFSPILLRLMATLARDDVSFAELAKIIEKDPVLAGNVLRMVNSALYGRRGTVNSVAHSIAIMGLHKLRNYALGVSIAAVWGKLVFPPGWSMRAFNLHSVGTAILADSVALEAQVTTPESAFAAGLFHDLGKLLVAISMPGEFVRIRDLYTAGGRTLVACEREILGFDHSEISGEAVRGWNLPRSIVEAVESHHQTDLKGSPLPLAAVVGLASDTVNAAGYCVEADSVVASSDSPATILARILNTGRATIVYESLGRELDILRTFL